jgi:serine/threonine protein kinase
LFRFPEVAFSAEASTDKLLKFTWDQKLFRNLFPAAIGPFSPGPIPQIQHFPVFLQRFSPEFQDFIALCLDKDPQARPKPNELVTHPWIALCQHKHVDVAAWLREALTRPVPPRDEY